MIDPDSWAVVLSRPWSNPDLTDALVATVADAPAEAARPALRNALVALGTGLADGDPADWSFDEERLRAVAPAVATALLRHSDVLVRPLAAVATGTADAVSATALRGLAVLVAMDAGAETERGGRVGERIAAALSHPHPDALRAAAAASAAFVAVREHGADLAHVMEQFRRKAEAEAKAELWDATFGIGFAVAGVIPTRAPVVSPLETLITHLLGADGSFTHSPDRQQHHPGLEAVQGAVAAAGTDREGRSIAAGDALAAYRATLHAFGTPVAPPAADDPLGEKLLDSVATDVLGGMVGDGLHLVPSDLRDTAGGALVDAGKDQWESIVD
jgi:hypothetical protein